MSNEVTDRELAEKAQDEFKRLFGDNPNANYDTGWINGFAWALVFRDRLIAEILAGREKGEN